MFYNFIRCAKKSSNFNYFKKRQLFDFELLLNSQKYRITSKNPSKTKHLCPVFEDILYVNTREILLTEILFIKTTQKKGKTSFYNHFNICHYKQNLILFLFTHVVP